MPEQFGKYLLLDRINQGGMAEVYLAKAFGFGGADQLIALKRIRKEVSDDPAFVEMFVREAKIAVQLNHANVAQVFELGKHESHYFIAMEYVAGRDLRAVLNRANHQGLQLPEHLVLLMIAGVLEGLDFAHRKEDASGRPLGIVHRDVSPHNVILSYTGEVKIIDFGIAGAANEAQSGTPGVLQGKYGYMAPEQVLGKGGDARTDIFSCGILLYELLTQKRLFEGASDFSILEKVRYAEVYPPSLVAPRVGGRLDEVVLRALQQRPEDRYASASDMHDAVVEVMLAQFGHPTPRELANLMRALFAQEIKTDLKLLEQARELTAARATATPERQAATTSSPGLPGSGNGTTTPSVPNPFVSAPNALGGPSSGTSAVAAGGSDDDPDTHPEAQLPGQVEKTDITKMPATPERVETTQPAVMVAALQPEPGSMSAQKSPVRDARKRASKVVPLSPPGMRTSVDIPVLLNPTVMRPAWKRKVSRDHIIVAAAVIVAISLVLVSWLITRAGNNKVGQVMIHSVPPAASVAIDGSVVGTTPYSAANLPVGRHTMTLERIGYQSESRVIDIVPNEMLPVQLVLKPVAGGGAASSPRPSTPPLGAR